MLNAATIGYIGRHADEDVRRLALRGCRDPEVDLPMALDQIAGRQTARRKMPSWAAVEGIVYPPHLSMEQCSSEPTARYKAAVAGRGRLMVDLTGGFGVDYSFLARSFSRAVYVERQEHLCRIARHNFGLLGLDNVEVVCADAVDYLSQISHLVPRNSHLDLIYMDPARRDDRGGRTYAISDCTPDVIAIRDLLLQKASRVLLKLSPMLDWRKAVSDLGAAYVSEVHIVSVANECKELLVVMEREAKGLRLVCVNDDTTFVVPQVSLSSQGPLSPPTILEPRTSHLVPRTSYLEQTSYLPPRTYLYEPNASIMKAGCFAELSHQFGVAPVARDSHLFVSPTRVDGFPGRTFCIAAVTSLNKRELKTHLAGLTQANIAVRNFPLTVAELRRRLKLADGGSTYIFATTLADGEHVLLICQKENN